VDKSGRLGITQPAVRLSDIVKVEIGFAAIDAGASLCQERSAQTSEAGALNKNDLIAAVAAETELSKDQASAALDAAFDTIARQLRKGGEVKLFGFGTFYVSQRKACQGRNPRTGEAIRLSATRAPKFKAGKHLRDGLN
jgi:DNA-binding protein HU-beta